MNKESSTDVRVLHRDQLSSSNRQEGERGYVNIRISAKCHNALTRIQSESLLRTKGQVVDYLVSSVQTKSPIIPTANLELLLSDDRPIQICGGSGEGKSFFVKQTVPRIAAPVFIVDIAGEYETIKKISVGDLYSFKWDSDGNTRVRFVPTNNAQIAMSELRTIFSFLNTEKMRRYRPDKVPSGILSKWVFIIEEAHRLGRESSFSNFLFESRKFTRKLVVVGSDPKLYSGVCKLLRAPSPAAVDSREGK